MDITENINNRLPYGNPFVYNAPVRRADFCNRDEIINKILKETVRGTSQGSVWITGERKVGKTSLLRYIQSRYEKYDEKIQLYEEDDYYNAAFIYLNTQDNRTPEDFYRNLRQCLKSKLDLTEIKKEYGRSFKETINGWGGDKLPKRTMEKLKDLSAYIIKNAGDRSLSLIFKGIEEYLKMQLNA